MIQWLLCKLGWHIEVWKPIWSGPGGTIKAPYCAVCWKCLTHMPAGWDRMLTGGKRHTGEEKQA